MDHKILVVSTTYDSMNPDLEIGREMDIFPTKPDADLFVAEQCRLNDAEREVVIYSIQENNRFWFPITG